VYESSPSGLRKSIPDNTHLKLMEIKASKERAEHRFLKLLRASEVGANLMNVLPIE